MPTALLLSLLATLDGGAAALPQATIVSGGVSLGSYQAGLLHYLAQARLASGEVGQARVVTGASAGAINAFLTAVSECRKPVAHPEDSWFWKTWIPVGIEAIANPDAVTELTLFSTKPLDDALERIGAEWKDGWNEQPCRASLGVTATRVTARRLPLDGTGESQANVTLPQQTERLILRIEGPGGSSPGIVSWAPPSSDEQTGRYRRVDLRVEPGGRLSETVGLVLRASSAFPGAWPFVRLPLVGEAEWPRFFDGGVFDNNPLKLALRLLSWDAQASPDAPQPKLTYVEPDATAWRTENVYRREDARRSFFATWGLVLRGLVESARGAELVSTLEENEGTDLQKRIEVPLRREPVLGSYLFNFLAFLDADFRRYDFFAGMADAHAYLEGRPGVVLPEVDSPEFRCVLQVRASPDVKPQDLGRLSACAALTPGQATKNLIALLQATRQVKRWLEHCQSSDVECTRLEELELLSRALHDAGFIFHDRALADQPMVAAVREKLHPLIRQLARKQPGLEASVLSVGAKAALDSLSYRPAAFHFGLGLNSRNGAEFEFGHRWAKQCHADWCRNADLRFAAGAKVHRLQSVQVRGADPDVRERFSATLEASVHPLVLQWAPAWPVQLAVQAGPALSMSLVGTSVAVLRASAQAAFTFSLMQRLYVRLAGLFFLDGCSAGACPNVLAPFQDDRAALAGTFADWSVSVGWRFLE